MPEVAAVPEVLRYAAFTDAGRGGNPAGVVLDAAGMDDAAMLAVARDVGYSETAFVTAGAPGRRTVRYFSPEGEVAFCGHATVATAVALAERWTSSGGTAGDRPAGDLHLALDTPAGTVHVSTATLGSDVTATLTSVPTRTEPAAPAPVAAALAALRWRPDDLDHRYPVHVAYAGNDHLVLGVRSRAVLAGLDYDYRALRELMAAEGWTTVHAFWAETDVLFHARDPFPPGGVVEDPATGAAAAAFGGYLRSLGLVRPGTRVTIRQGEDMGRPSLLLVDVDARPAGVRVTGSAAPIP